MNRPVVDMAPERVLVTPAAGVEQGRLDDFARMAQSAGHEILTVPGLSLQLPQASVHFRSLPTYEVKAVQANLARADEWFAELGTVAVVVNSKNGRYGEPWYVDPFAVGVLGLAWMHGRRGYVSGELPRDRAGGTNREIAYLLATYGVTALDGTLNFRRQPSS